MLSTGIDLEAFADFLDVPGVLLKFFRKPVVDYRLLILARYILREPVLVFSQGLVFVVKQNFICRDFYFFTNNLFYLMNGVK